LFQICPNILRFTAVILLDELEKAHKDVSMILLQLLDEGTLTDSQGRKVDFKNTIICLTSNIGSDILSLPTSTSASKPGEITLAAKEQVLERTQDYFPPELLNRLDTIQIFNKLSKQAIMDVVDLRLNDVQERLKSKRIKLDVEDGAKAVLADRGYSEMYGARAIARIVRTDVLFPLAQKLLKGTIRDGDVVRVGVKSGGEGLIEIRDNHSPESVVDVSAAVEELVEEEDEGEEVKG
jgi:ATP-dependent Clp protease ATP-binding subunit ClpB